MRRDQGWTNGRIDCVSGRRGKRVEYTVHTVAGGLTLYLQGFFDQTMGMAKNVMFSGSAVYTPYYESKIMALYAEAIGIPKERIYIETEAEHSTENIFYSYRSI